MHDPVHQAEQQLAQKRVEEQQLATRRRQSLLSLIANPDFTVAFVNGYLAEVTAGFLDQLRTCHVDDLELARQRWLDAEAFLTNLKAAIEDVVKPDLSEDDARD